MTTDILLTEATLLHWWKRRQPIGSASAEAYRKHYANLQDSINGGWHSEEREHHRKERQIWIATLVSTVLAVILTACTFYQTRRQADAAVKTLDVEERPWIGAPSIVAETRKNRNDTRILLSIHNNGKTPTSGLYLGAGKSHLENWRQEATKFCESGLEWIEKRPKEFSIPSVIPNGNILIGPNPGSVDTVITEREFIQYEMMLEPHIVGCILYRSISNSDIHKTKFLIELKRIDGLITENFAYTIEPD